MTIDMRRFEEFKAKLFRVVGISRFYVRHPHTLKNHDFVLMKSSLNERVPTTNRLMYLARIYTSDIGQIKIYYDNRIDRISRAKILDLMPIYENECIQIHAKLSLIDRDEIIWAPFDSLYDFTQATRFYEDLKPEILRCKLYICKNLPKNFDTQVIDSFFLKNAKFKEFTIKIIGFRENSYYVDLITNNGLSFCEEFIKEYIPKIQIELSQILTTPKKLDSEDLEEISYQENDHNDENEMDFLFKRPSDFDREETYHKGNFISSLKYFRYKLRCCNKNSDSSPTIKNRLITVKIIHWFDPKHITIIPVTSDFADHECFEKELNIVITQSIVDESDLEASKRVYKRGDRCYFRNKMRNGDHEDKSWPHDQSPWSRGVIVKVPIYTGKSFKTGLINPNHFVYLIRSIDYGLLCFRGAEEIRKVKDMKEFSRIGPYGLRVKLFGIHPLEKDFKLQNNRIHHRFSQMCNYAMDVWIRDRIELDIAYVSNFYVLFRNEKNNILKENQIIGDEHAEITLFHRLDEFPRKLADVLQKVKSKPPFSCLNTELFEKGFVSDRPVGGKSSLVQHDEYLVNYLNSLKLLS